jgi:mono/diheme cytochrome c family protein
MSRHLLLAAPTILVAAALALAGCGDKIDAVQEGACTVDLGSVTYQGQIKAIMDGSCTGCHASGLSGAARNGAPPAVDLDSYGGLTASADGSNKRIQNGTMPPSGSLPQGERALFQCWIDLGKQEK